MITPELTKEICFRNYEGINQRLQEKMTELTAVLLMLLLIAFDVWIVRKIWQYHKEQKLEKFKQTLRKWLKRKMKIILQWMSERTR